MMSELNQNKNDDEKVRNNGLGSQLNIKLNDEMALFCHIFLFSFMKTKGNWCMKETTAKWHD